MQNANDKVYQLLFAALGGAIVALLGLVLMIALSSCTTKATLPYSFQVQVQIVPLGDEAGTLRLFSRVAAPTVEVRAGQNPTINLMAYSDETDVLAVFEPDFSNGPILRTTCKIDVPPPPGYILRYRLEVAADRLACTWTQGAP